MLIGTITITSLPAIGNSVANDTLIPVVNMNGVPTTQKMTVANLLQTGLGANLGDVANVTIGGGTNGYVLQTDGAGNLTWTAQTGGSGNGTVGGTNTQVQFNDSGDFGGNSGFTFNKTAGALAITKVDTADVYHLDGVVIENADLTHGATAAVVIPANGNTSVPAQITNTYGNIALTTGINSGSLKTWTFDNTGNLVLPANTFTVKYANGTAVSIPTVGNIATANFDGNASNVLHGDGSWSADTTTYGNSNVATFLAAYGSNTITTTGNVSVGNIIASTSLRGVSLSVTGTGTAINASQGNILTNEVTGTKFNFLNGLYTASITSGATSNYTLTLPTTAGSNGEVLTTNGSGGLSWTTGSGGNGTYGNAEVATFLAAFGSNTITTTGNVTVGNLTLPGNISGNTNGYTIGYLNVPQVSASNATLALGDAGKHYYSTTAGNLTLTIPTNANVAFATGTAISIVVQASGNILVNAASGVTLYMAGNSSAANRVVGSYGMATLLKVATDAWFINGTGVS